MPQSCSWHPHDTVYQPSNRKDYSFGWGATRSLGPGERIVDEDTPGAGSHTLGIFKDSSTLRMISNAWFEAGHLHVNISVKFHRNNFFLSDDYWASLVLDQDFECIDKDGKCTPGPKGDPLLQVQNGFGVSVGATVKFDPQAALKGELDIYITYACTTGTITQQTTATAQLGGAIPLGSTTPTTTISPQGSIAWMSSISGTASLTDSGKISSRCVAPYGYGYPGTGIGVGNLVRPPG